jgi:hypothetical protein
MVRWLEIRLELLSQLRNPLDYFFYYYLDYIIVCCLISGLAALMSRRQVPSVALGFSLLPLIVWSPRGISMLDKIFDQPERLWTTGTMIPIATFAIVLISAAATTVAIASLVRRVEILQPSHLLWPVATVHALHMFVMTQSARGL